MLNYLSLFIATMMVCLLSINADPNCTYYDSYYYNDLHNSSCEPGQWLNSTQVINGSTYYLCCAGTGPDQVLRDEEFCGVVEIAQFLGHYKCFKYVLCESGCSDVISYGYGDTNPTPKDGDSDFTKQSLTAYYTGQKIGDKKNETLCPTSCSQLYPNCKTTDFWYYVYHYGHKFGITSFFITEQVICSIDGIPDLKNWPNCISLNNGLKEFCESDVNLDQCIDFFNVK